ncbi:MAG: hypothetical protein ABSB29_05750 [Nitrososphaerales archaeon]|jgi:hypothetical protein
MRLTLPLVLVAIGVTLLFFAVVYFDLVDNWNINHCFCSTPFCGACLGTDYTSPIFGSIGVGCLFLAFIFSIRGKGEP